MRFGAGHRIGSYRVERELGSTTTGALYQAVHLVLPRRAVIKVMHFGSGRLLQALAVQLLREACLLEALSHPGIPQVYESGLLEDKRPWFALEWIEGPTLAERIVKGVLPSLEVARIVRDLAAILEHAHKRGVIHRALRPDRVVLATDRRFAIALPDWTDARAHDTSGAQRDTVMPTREGRAYLAPELIRGDAPDDRADIYAIGVMAYQALVGVLPRGDSTKERCPDAPVELAQLIDQMLSPDRFDRPTAAEIRADLDFLAEALSVDAQADIPASSSATLRIRRPRWTPAIQPGPNATLAPVSGEIIVKPKPNA
jgi:eukaryotic-like serine/threonine-protein kinase